MTDDSLSASWRFDDMITEKELIELVNDLDASRTDDRVFFIDGRYYKITRWFALTPPKEMYSLYVSDDCIIWNKI